MRKQIIGFSPFTFTFYFVPLHTQIATQMRKTIFIIINLLLALTVSASGKGDAESLRRVNHLAELYNQDLNDSLIHQGRRDLEYDLSHECWENYYETWMHIVNTYVFMGQVNTGLSEVEKMHADAIQRNDHYGLALSNYAMGNVYQNMGYLNEAVTCYQNSLEHIQHANVDSRKTNDIYSYYCDALNAQKKYEAMGEVTAQWKAYLDRIKEEPNRQKSLDVWCAYYYLACAQQHLGLNELETAEQNILEAEKRKGSSGEFISMSVLYYRAQLCLQRKDYARALELNTQRMKKSQGYTDKSSLVLIYEQRAKIQMGLGQYREAAEMYRDVYELTDSLYQKDARTQINELSTLFRVNELSLEKRLERTRNTRSIVVIIAVALALLMGFSLWMNQRLRRKNEELAIARDQARESSRMKTHFIQNISHEIRTPLNILSGFAQIMAQPGADLPQDVREEASRNIQENTDRITSLINRLLALSESSSRSYIERNDTISVNELCHNAIFVSGIGNDANHHFEFHSDVDDEQQVTTSKEFATQALGHLLDNAMKFTPEGGSIRMGCCLRNDRVVVSIEDTGCGIPSEKAEDIFGEFVQLDEFKDGVGIGLPLSRNIANRLGGDIALDTHYTNGARFLFTLPLK